MDGNEEVDDFAAPYSFETDPEEEEPRQKKVKKHVCTECDEIFETRLRLVAHMEDCFTEAFENEVEVYKPKMRNLLPPQMLQIANNVSDMRMREAAPFRANILKRKLDWERQGSPFRMNLVPHGVRLSQPAQMPPRRIQEGIPRQVVEAKKSRVKMATAAGARFVIDQTPFLYPNNTYAPEVVVKTTMRIKCPECYKELLPKSFPDHYRIHTGELPYPCYFCDERFRTSRQRITHAKTHNQCSPCECDECDFKCASPKSMDNHRKQIHGHPIPTPIPRRSIVMEEPITYETIYLHPDDEVIMPTEEQLEVDAAANSIYHQSEPSNSQINYDQVFDEMFCDINSFAPEIVPEIEQYDLKNELHNNLILEEETFVENGDQIVPY